MQKREITLGHSPDADDAFMFYALAKEKLDTGELKFTNILQDIETLNRRAMNEELDITAISIHAYAYVSDKYALLPCGASIGDRYGPMVVAKGDFDAADLAKKIAVPGAMTTAFLALKLFLKDFNYTVIPFDQIMQRVADGEFDAGLIIHEGQLTYSNLGLRKVIDLGQWWYEETGLPLPLGANAVRRKLGDELMKRSARILKESIEYGLSHREEAIAYAMNYARDMDRALADKFVGMYVNDYTLDFGERGRRAVSTLLERAYQEGVISHTVEVDFVD